MNIEEIRALAQLMNETGLTCLEISEDDKKVKLELGVPARPYENSVRPVMAPALPQEEPGTVTINSPMVGVFYAASSPESKVFVSIGDTVKQGDVLCIIEAMKLMNEITAEQDGQIVEILAGNGQVVEFGQPLIKMKPAI